MKAELFKAQTEVGLLIEQAQEWGEYKKTMSNNEQLTEPMVISQTASTDTAHGIYVEHLKKNVTMSNNKQSSIEWFVEELTKQNMFMNLFLKEIEQAKAMHKQEIIDAVDGFPLANRNLEGTDYYNETFGDENYGN